MKNLLLLVAFCSATLFCSAQYTVINHTSETLNVGLRFTYTSAPCSSDADDSQYIAPFSSYTFSVPPGMMILRVEYWSVAGSAYAYAPCGSCMAPPVTGPYSFWGYTCSKVNIR